MDLGEPLCRGTEAVTPLGNPSAKYGPSTQWVLSVLAEQNRHLTLIWGALGRFGYNHTCTFMSSPRLCKRQETDCQPQLPDEQMEAQRGPRSSPDGRGAKEGCSPGPRCRRLT